MNEEEVLMRKRLSSCSVLSETCDWAQECPLPKAGKVISGGVGFLFLKKKPGVCWEHCFGVGEGKARPD